MFSVFKTWQLIKLSKRNTPDSSSSIDLRAKSILVENDKIKITLTDDNVIEGDISSLLDNVNISNASLDNGNKKITLTRNDNSTTDIDLTELYNIIDGKMPIPTTAGVNNVAIFDINRKVVDSVVSVDNGAKTLTIKNGTVIKQDCIELYSEGSGNRPSYIDFHSDDVNNDYGLRLRREAGENGNFNIDFKGGGDIITSPENGQIFQCNGFAPLAGSNNAGYAGVKNSIAFLNNVDDLIKQGVYNSHSNFLSGLPISGWVYITVKRHSNLSSTSWVTQEVESMGANNLAGIRYIRNKINGTWDNWTPITLNKEEPLRYLSSVTNYQNGWVNYSNGWKATIVKKADGMVYINGLIRNGNNGTVVCTLPSVYKPNAGGQHRLFICMVSGNRFHRIDIRSNGEMYVTTEGQRNNTSWISLQMAYPAYDVVQ